MTIDFTKGIGYTIHRFPDGEVHLQVDEIDRKDKVDVRMRIRCAEDLFLLMQLSDILHRQGVEVENLHIPYLMSARCDRVFSFDRPFSLSIVAKVINDVGAACVHIDEPHSFRTAQLIPNYVYTVTMREILADYCDDTLCFPDMGAQDRYGRDIFGANIELVCQKVRDVNTGQLTSFKVVNPEAFTGGAITIVDDLCDGGGTFVGLAPKLRELKPDTLRLVVVHAVQLNGIKRVAEVFDEVVITNTYEDWDRYELPDNVKVVKVLP